MTAVDIFDALYSRIENRNRFLSKLRFYAAARFLLRLSANVFLPLYFRITACCPKNSIIASNKTSGRVIVSLTSFPARIERLWLAVESLLRQSVKPDAVIVWLSGEQFPTIDSVPKSLLRLRGRGLRIEIRGGDLRSHKKYFYAFSEFPEDTVITADDDIIYPSHALAELAELADKHRGAVCARFATGMRWKESSDELDKYASWRGEDFKRPQFFGSGGGTLFPPHAFDSRMLSADDAARICPTADDIWLNAAVRLSGAEIRSMEKKFSMLPVMNISTASLHNVNNVLSQNDVQLAAVRKFCLEKFGTDPFLKTHVGARFKP